MRFTGPVETEVAVIGGGAAGMMAALSAAGRGRKVLLLEGQERCGRKLGITGKGRCNLTNACTGEEFLRNIPRNGKFLQSALRAFPPEAAMAFFRDLGLDLKTERGNRVFPVSDRASDVVRTLEGCLEKRRVQILHVRARRVLANHGRVTAIVTDGGEIRCQSAILATGGLSYPRTGSTGDGYRMAKELGHSITALRPSLVPLVSKDWFCPEMQGLSLKNVRLAAFDGTGRRVYSEQGELLFTHFGVSGPLALSASAYLPAPETPGCRLELDLKPALDEKKLDARLLRDFEQMRNRDFANALDGLAPKLLRGVLVRRSGIPGQTKVNAVTREQRKKLLGLLKCFSVGITGTRPIAEAIVTAGGVSTAEVNPRTMASKRVAGLFFAGEVLDVDALTGGFNLHIAWCTGLMAGNHA